MASNDLRDVLNLPSDHSSTPRPSKKARTGGPRPNLKGLAREVQNLGGDNPIAIVPEVSFFKKRRFGSRKPAVKWELKGFTNSARDDGGALLLRHWKRKTEQGAPPEAAQDAESQPTEDGVSSEKKRDGKPEDSSFAKFNVRIPVPQYNEDQYRSNLQSNDWTKEETDYLLGLAKEYDLRWPIIWDRYEYAPKPPPGEEDNGTSTAVVPAQKPRTMEDLKARYYEVAAKMMAVQKPAQYMTRPEFELYEIMQNFNPEQERKRKEFALNTMARSKDEAREEESLLLEIKRILARTERFNEERRELYNRLDYPATDSDINSFKSSAGLQALLQNLMSTDKSKKRKSIMGPGEGVSPGGAVPGSAVSESGPNRRESIAAAASSGRRESDARGVRTSAEPTPTTATSTGGGASSAANNKKKGSSAQQPERRKLTPHEEQVYGVAYHERLGSGPTFRYERINKLYSHKSGQQQLRMTNALAELDVPPRLVMPTAAVTAQFEVLWGAVAALVDMRKLSDKLEGEIKLEEAKKAEREKARGGCGEGEEGEEGEEEKGKGNDKEKEKEGGDKTQEKEVNGDTTGEGGQADAGDGGIKEEPGTEKSDGAGPESSGAHKRSASVLSSTSDKSAKRQKK